MKNAGATNKTPFLFTDAHLNLHIHHVLSFKPFYRISSYTWLAFFSFPLSPSWSKCCEILIAMLDLLRSHKKWRFRKTFTCKCKFHLGGLKKTDKLIDANRSVTMQKLSSHFISLPFLKMCTNKHNCSLWNWPWNTHKATSYCLL